MVIKEFLVGDHILIGDFDTGYKYISRDEASIRDIRKLIIEMAKEAAETTSKALEIHIGVAISRMWFRSGIPPVIPIHDCRIVEDCIINPWLIVIQTGKSEIELKHYGKTSRRSITTKEKNMFKKNPTANRPTLSIKDVIFNNPATIVLWSDGTKTVVKCDSKMEEYDPEKGMALAICKKFLGTNKSKGNYYNVFKKYLDNYRRSEFRKETDDFLAKRAAFGKFIHKPEEPEDYISVKDYAESHKLSVYTVRRKIKNKEIKAIKQGGKWTIPVVHREVK